MKITEQQIKFFHNFGFLKMTQAFRDDLPWIISEFENVFLDRGIVHDGTKRSTVVPFIDQREKLATLLDHPVIQTAATALLGPDFNYLGGDGNYYSGNTQWHTDGQHDTGLYVKMAFYLDPVKKETGALRVIPGAHKVPLRWSQAEFQKSEETWGIPPQDIPAYALESEPGDLLIFNHNILHASFGGSGWRRMFTLNLSARAQNKAEVDDLKSFINGFERFWVDQPHSELMRKTASPQRMRHLQQVIDNEYELPARAAKCRKTMAEPSRH